MFIEKVEPPGTVLEKAELANTEEESLNQCRRESSGLGLEQHSPGHFKTVIIVYISFSKFS